MTLEISYILWYHDTGNWIWKRCSWYTATLEIYITIPRQWGLNLKKMPYSEANKTKAWAKPSEQPPPYHLWWHWNKNILSETILQTHRFANLLDFKEGFCGAYPQYPRTEKAIKNREAMRTLIRGQRRANGSTLPIQLESEDNSQLANGVITPWGNKCVWAYRRICALRYLCAIPTYLIPNKQHAQRAKFLFLR